MRNVGISVMAVVVLVTTSLHAGVIPGRWEKLDNQPPGKQIIVTLESGDRMECGLRSSGPEDLTVIDESGKELSVPKSEVQKIVSAEKIKDGLGNGVAMGAGVGLGVGLLMLGMPCINVFGECPSVSRRLPVIPLVVGIGAGLGLAVDVLRTETEVLYRAP